VVRSTATVVWFRCPPPFSFPARRQLWESRNSLAAIRERLDAAWSAVDAEAAALYNQLVLGAPAGDGGGAPGSPAASIVMASASTGAASATAAAGGGGGGGGAVGGASGAGGAGGGGPGGLPPAVFTAQVRAYVKLRTVFYLRSNTRRRLPAIFGAATTHGAPGPAYA